MNLEYEWGKEELTEELRNKRKKFNIVAFIILLFIYIWFISGGIKSNIFDNKWLLVYGLIYITITLLILLVSTKIYISINLKRNKNNYGKYIIVLDDKNICVKFNNQEIKYNKEDILLKVKKEYFKVYTKSDKIGLTFRKKILKDDYEKVLEYLRK